MKLIITMIIVLSALSSTVLADIMYQTSGKKNANSITQKQIINQATKQKSKNGKKTSIMYQSSKKRRKKRSKKRQKKSVMYQTKNSNPNINEDDLSNQKNKLKPKQEKKINRKNMALYAEDLKKLAKTMKQNADDCTKGNLQACSKAMEIEIIDAKLSCKYQLTPDACDVYEELKEKKKQEQE